MIKRPSDARAQGNRVIPFGTPGRLVVDDEEHGERKRKRKRERGREREREKGELYDASGVPTVFTVKANTHSCRDTYISRHERAF